MSTGADNLVKGVDDHSIYVAIRQRLAPLFLPTPSTDISERCLNELNEQCDEALYPLREFVESELADYDYQYNDIVGFDSGKRSAELTLMLEPGILFRSPNTQTLVEHGGPIWALSLQLSLVFPVFIMAIEKWELSTARSNWIECTSDNGRFGDLSEPIQQCLMYLQEAGFSAISRASLARVPTDEQLPRNKDRLNIAQLLFNEVFGDDLDVLSFE